MSSGTSKGYSEPDARSVLIATIEEQRAQLLRFDAKVGPPMDYELWSDEALGALCRHQERRLRALWER